MSTPRHEWMELCGAVRDESATAEQVARLEAILAADPEARRFYRRFTQVHALLERYEPLPGANPARAPSVRPTSRVRFQTWLALAACLAILAALALRFASAPAIVDPPASGRSAQPVAFIQDFHACTLVPRAGPAVALDRGYQLQQGDIVATASKGNAVIRFPGEKTLFILTADTRAWFAREGSAKIVHLMSGRVFGDVSPQRDGAQWRILTADGEARVLGTQLAVSALDDGTRVAVTSGRVRVTARDSRQTVETPAGYAAQLTPTTAMLVKLDPSEPTRVASFSVVDADTNQPIPGFETLADGAVVNLATLPTRRLNIKANCQPQQVGMVRFEITGTNANGAALALVQPQANGFPHQIEIYYPYMLAGDPSIEGERLPGHSYAWTPPAGRYTLIATAYAGQKQWGARGEALTVHFEVVDSEPR